MIFSKSKGEDRNGGFSRIFFQLSHLPPGPGRKNQIKTPLLPNKTKPNKNTADTKYQSDAFCKGHGQ